MNDLGRFKKKLKPLYAAMLSLMVFGMPSNALAASCAAGAITIAKCSGVCDMRSS